MYELTDEEWEKVKDLLPPEKDRKRGRPSKPNRMMLNAMVWLARSGATWRELSERYGPWETVYSRFRLWLGSGVLDEIFRVLSMDARLERLSRDSAVVRAHRASADERKRAAKPKGDEQKAD